MAIVEEIKNHFTSKNGSHMIPESTCSYHENKELNEYVLEYDLDINDEKPQPPEFVIITDISGSMEEYANYVISKTFPAVLDGLNYGDTKIHLITFESEVNYYNINSTELKQSRIGARGGTRMNETIDVLNKILEICQNYSNQLRILVISDGDIDDQSLTKSKGNNLYQKYKNMFKINSQAVRLITSSDGDPETEGIVSLLKLNNVKNNTYLIEFNAQNIERLADAIIPLFIDDNLSGYQLKIKSNISNLKNYPWEENTYDELPVQKGKNIFFSNSKSELKMSDKIILCKEGENVDSNNYETILGTEKISNILSQIKMNKVLNTKESLKENSRICDYFNILEKKIEKREGNSMQFLISCVNSLNNSDISNLNNKQKADFIQNSNESYMRYQINKSVNNNKKSEKKLTNLNYRLSKEGNQLTIVINQLKEEHSKEINELKEEQKKLKEDEELRTENQNQFIKEITEMVKGFRTFPIKENKSDITNSNFNADTEMPNEKVESTEGTIKCICKPEIDY